VSGSHPMPKRPRRRQVAMVATLVALAAGLLAPPGAGAMVDYLGLREQLEVQRPAIRTALKPYMRAPDAAAFQVDKPGAVFAKYLDAAWKSIDGATKSPEAYAAMGKFRGTVDPKNDTQRQVLGVLLGDYMQARYGDDILREMKALAAFKTFNNVVDKNSDNTE